jgi:hypothetical protein
MIERVVSYWPRGRTTTDAIEAAKSAAALGNLLVVGVDRVIFAPSKDGEPSWEVRLRVRQGP